MQPESEIAYEQFCGKVFNECVQDKDFRSFDDTKPSVIRSSFNRSEKQQEKFHDYLDHENDPLLVVSGAFGIQYSMFSISKKIMY